MGIDERIRKHRESQSDDTAVTATGDILLVFVAASIFSVILPIRSQTLMLGNTQAVVTIILLVTSGIAFSLLAASDWDASNYGLTAGATILSLLILTGLYLGPGSLFWLGSAPVMVTAGGWHIWFGILSRESGPDLVRPTETISLVLVIGLVGLLLFRLSSFLSALGSGGYVLVSMVAFMIAGYGLIRPTGLVADKMVAWVGVASFVFLLYLSFITNPNYRMFGADAILFGQYAADLLLSGQNPYAYSMAPAFDKYAIDTRFVTYRIDGSIVESYSYPGGAIILFALGEAIGVPNINWISLAFLAVTLAYLVMEATGPWKLASIGVIVACQEFTMFSSGGVFDIIYILFLLIGMKYWRTLSYRYSAFVVGLAFSIKQIPWLIGPFVLIWLYKRHDVMSGFRHGVTTTLGYGLAGFLLPNLPFLTHPIAWVEGVLTPVAGGASLTLQGITLSSLTTHNILYLPRSYFVALLAIAYLLLITIYFLWYDQLKWTAWILPAAVLFFHYRSLLNYYIFTPIIAYYAILLRHDLTTSHSLMSRIRGLREARHD